MSSPSSLPPPPPPPPGSTPPPGAPSPPPPPPPPSSNPAGVTGANYFFGFVITFVVLLLLFVGCGIGSWRRFRLIGTAWDEHLQDMEGHTATFAPRKRGRRKMVRPVFSETWMDPTASTRFAPDKARWEGLQPFSTALIWSRSTMSTWVRETNATTTPPRRASDGVIAALRSYVFPRRPRCDHTQRPPPVARPPPEAVQVAVMIAMPSPPSLTSRAPPNGPRYVGQSRVGEYQIGVARISWPSGEGP